MLEELSALRQYFRLSVSSIPCYLIATCSTMSHLCLSICILIRLRSEGAALCFEAFLPVENERWRGDLGANAVGHTDLGGG